MLDVRLYGYGNGHDRDTSFTQEIPAGDEGFVYLLSGRGLFSNIFPITKNIEKNDLRTLKISSPDSEFITFLYDSLLQPHIRERIRVGSMVFRIESVSKIAILDVQPYGASSSLITLITGTPITIRLKDVLSSSTDKTYYDGYYWRKEDPIGLFVSQLQDHLLKKYQQFKYNTTAGL
jgi:CRISPR-associated endoribonuclease Cas6